MNVTAGGVVMLDLWILLAGLILIASVLAILVSMFLFFRSPKKGYEIPPRRGGTRGSARPPIVLSSSKAKTLQADLTRCLHGDKAAAQRLYQYAKQGCPGQTDAWYWEKAIEQYERDRC